MTSGGKALRGCTICFTGITDTNEKQKLVDMVKELGGVHQDNFDNSVTHLIAQRVGSSKHYVASLIECRVVRKAWLEACASTGRRVPESEYGLSLLEGLVIGVTGLSMEERDIIKDICEEHGAHYMPHLTKEATHLLAKSPVGAKYSFARKNNITVVRPAWLYDSVRNRSLLDYYEYEVTVRSNSEDHESGRDMDQVAATQLDHRRINNRSMPPPPPSQVGSKMTDNSQCHSADEDGAGVTWMDGCRVWICSGPTGMSDQELQRVKTAIRHAGGMVMPRICPLVTHVLIPDVNNMSSLLSSITSSFPSHACIVDIRWLLRCASLRALNPPPSADTSSSAQNNSNANNTNNNNNNIIDTSTSIQQRSKRSGADPTAFLALYAPTAPFEGEEKGKTDDKDHERNGRRGRVFQGLKVMVTDNVDQTVVQQLEDHGAEVVGGEHDDADCVIEGHGCSSSNNNDRDHDRLVSEDWMQACIDAGRLIDRDASPIFRPVPPISPNTTPPPSSFTVCTSGFHGTAKHRLHRALHLLGVGLSSHLQQTCTHLVCADTSSKKYHYARRWGIPVVREGWVWGCLQYGGMVDHHRFRVPDDGEHNDSNVNNNNNNNSSKKISDEHNKDDDNGNHDNDDNGDDNVNKMDVQHDNDDIHADTEIELGEPTLDGKEEENENNVNENENNENENENENDNNATEINGDVNMDMDMNINTEESTPSSSAGDPFSFVMQELQRGRSIAAPYSARPSHYPSPPNGHRSKTPRRNAKMLMSTEVLSTQQQRSGGGDINNDSTTGTNTNNNNNNNTSSSSNTNTTNMTDSMTSDSTTGSSDGDHHDVSAMGSDADHHITKEKTMSNIMHRRSGYDDGDGYDSGGTATTTTTTTETGEQDMVLESQVVQYEHFVHKSVTRIFLLSGFSSNPKTKEKLHAMITELGGEVEQSASFTAKCTHLVCSKPSTTEKFLAATVAGKWVLKAEYVEQSHRKGQWLPEPEYEWSARNSDGGVAYPLCQAVDRCKTMPGRLFSGWTAILYGNDSMVQGISSILRAGGGRVVEEDSDTDYSQVTHLFADARHAEEPQVIEDMQRVQQCDGKILKLDYVPKYVQDPDTETTPYLLHPPSNSRKRTRSRSRSRSTTSVKRTRLRR